MTAQPVSKLTLGRFVTGELDTDEATAVEQSIAADPALAAQVARIQQARSAVAPFDAAALRARAAEASEDVAMVTPPAANDNRAFLAVIPILLAAAVALFFVIPSADQPVDRVTLRGASVLQVYHLESAGLSSYDDRALSSGDVLGFKVDPGTHDSVVLLSVDGHGALTVHYPAEGTTEPLTGAGVQALPGSIILDDAPGPEHFVAVFGKSVTEARTQAQRAWQSGGPAGLQDWAQSNDVDVAVVNRR